MNDKSSPADTLDTLYHRAFREFGGTALWNKRRLDNPSPEHAVAIARSLRIEGDREARELAEAIEEAARAALDEDRGQ